MRELVTFPVTYELRAKANIVYNAVYDVSTPQSPVYRHYMPSELVCITKLCCKHGHDTGRLSPT
jgi:hypothetical protein